MDALRPGGQPRSRRTFWKTNSENCSDQPGFSRKGRWRWWWPMWSRSAPPTHPHALRTLCVQTNMMLQHWFCLKGQCNWGGPFSGWVLRTCFALNPFICRADIRAGMNGGVGMSTKRTYNTDRKKTTSHRRPSEKSVGSKYWGRDMIRRMGGARYYIQTKC